MKITGTSPLQAVYGTQATRPTKVARPGSGPAAQVSISRDAAWISEMRHEARTQENVRTRVVEEVRASVQDGSFEAGVDLNHVIDGLLGDL